MVSSLDHIKTNAYYWAYGNRDELDDIIREAQQQLDAYRYSGADPAAKAQLDRIVCPMNYLYPRQGYTDDEWLILWYRNT